MTAVYTDATGALTIDSPATVMHDVGVGVDAIDDDIVVILLRMCVFLSVFVIFRTFLHELGDAARC